MNSTNGLNQLFHLDELAHPNDNVIDTDFIKVKGNAIIIGETTMAINNISMISTSNLSKTAFPWWSLIFVLFAAVFSSFNVLVSIICFAIFGIIAFCWYKNELRRKEMKKLNITLNCGRVYRITFYNQNFLEKVVDVLTDILSNPERKQNITINIRDNTFNDHSSALQTGGI